MKIVKKLACVLLVLSMTLPFTGCKDTTWTAKYNGEKLGAGVYMFYLLNGYSTATNMATDQNKSVLDQEIEGKSASVWITDFAINQVAIHYALEDKAKELDVSLTDEKKKELTDAIDTDWPNYKDICEQNKISKESYTAVVMNGSLRDEVFKAIYIDGKDKETGKVTEDELRQNYAFFNYISEGLGSLKKPVEASEDVEAVPLTDEEKKENEETTKKNTKIKEMMDTLLAEFSKKTDENAFKDTLALYVTKSNEINKDVEDYTEKTVEDFQQYEEPQFIPVKEDAEAEADMTDDDKKVQTAIKELAYDKAQLVTTETSVLFLAKYDLYKNKELFEKNEMNILSTYKGEEFTKILQDLADAIKDKITMNTGLTKTYTASTLILPAQQ